MTDWDLSHTQLRGDVLVLDHFLGIHARLFRHIYLNQARIPYFFVETTLLKFLLHKKYAIGSGSSGFSTALSIHTPSPATPLLERVYHLHPTVQRMIITNSAQVQ
jgi:hypothetical protein